MANELEVDLELVSVVVVSDYAANPENAWRDERAILTALSDQDLGRPFETILVENELLRGQVPEDLPELLPGLKIVFSDSTRSADLKDFGAAQVNGTLVAVLDADCVPAREWLRLLVEALEENRDVSAASGPTIYPDQGTVNRVLTVLDRGYDNHRERTVTRNVANNGTVFRREVLEEFPYPEADSPFVSSTRRILAMRSAGHKFWYEPDAVLVHGLPGWGFVVDLQRNRGYAMMIAKPTPRYTAIPPLLFKRIRGSVGQCRRWGRRQFKWWDWPVAGLFALTLPFFEIPGMLDAIHGEEAPKGTKFF